MVPIDSKMYTIHFEIVSGRICVICKSSVGLRLQLTMYKPAASEVQKRKYYRSSQVIFSIDESILVSNKNVHLSIWAEWHLMFFIIVLILFYPVAYRQAMRLLLMLNLPVQTCFLFLWPSIYYKNIVNCKCYICIWTQLLSVGLVMHLCKPNYNWTFNTSK